MKFQYIFVTIILIVGCFLIYFLNIDRHFKTHISAFRNKTIRHTAIILARRPTIKIFYHLNALLNAGVNAFLMCDESPSKYMIMTERVLYVNNESVLQYGLKRNFVWDRVFVWLYNQSSFDYVWIMEDDLTWTNVQHMINLFDRYVNNPADLLSRNIIYKDNRSYWIWWPRMYLNIFPENKWSGSLNMLCRISRRLIQAHQYYALQLLHTKQQNHSLVIDSNYYYQEFFIPTVAHMFNLTMEIYNHSNMDVHVSQLSEDNIRYSLKTGKQIFHPVKHDSQVLINAT